MKLKITIGKYLSRFLSNLQLGLDFILIWFVLISGSILIRRIVSITTQVPRKLLKWVILASIAMAIRFTFVLVSMVYNMLEDIFYYSTVL